MKYAIAVFLSVSAFAQGWGRREALVPVLEGRFVDAEFQFRKALEIYPIPQYVLLWQAEYAMERARFGEAAALIEAAAKQAPDHLPDRRRRAALLCAVGGYRDAYELALEGRKWDGRDVRKLKLPSPISLVVLGEIELARGEYDLAVSILDKASRMANDPKGFAALEWARSRVLRATAEVSAGLPQSALDTVAGAFRTAEREWGSAGMSRPGDAPGVAVGPTGRCALALLEAAPVLAATGNLAEAKTAYESAIPVLERELGPDAPRVVEARKLYAESSLSKNER